MDNAARSSYIEMAWKINSAGYHQLIKQYDNLDRKSDTVASRMARGIDRVGNSMLKAGQKTKVMSAAMGGALAIGVTQAAKLQHKYLVITNLLTTGGEKAGEAIRNVKKMQQQSLGISNKYGVSQQQIAKGYEELVRRGYSSKQALAAQETLVKGAIASGDDYTDVVHNSTAALEAFGLRSKNTATMTKNTKKVVNELAYAADLTATDFKDIGYGMTYVGATGKTANQSIGQVSAALGELSNNGQEASVAGTGLRKVYNSLASPGEKSGVPALKSIGLSADDLRDSKGKLKDLSDIFLLFQKHMKGMSDKKQFDFFHTFFGTTGQTSAMLLSQNATELKKLEKQVSKAPKKDYITQLANKNMKSTQQQWKIFKQNVMNVTTVMGGRLLPVLNDALKHVSKLTKWFDDLSGKEKTWVTYTAIGVAAFSPLMTITGMLIKNFRTLGRVASRFWGVYSKIHRLSANMNQGRAPWAKAPKSYSPSGTYATGSAGKNVSRMTINAAQVTVTGGGSSSFGDGSKIGRKVGTTSATYMASKSGKTGRTIGRAATKYSYAHSAKIGRRQGKTSTKYSYSGAARTGKKSGAAFSKASYAGSARTGKHIGLKMGNAAMGLAWAAWASDIGSDVSTAFKYGVSSKKGGKAVWSITGKSVGAAVGLALTGGDPVGAIIGAQIGDAFTQRFVKLWKKAIPNMKKNIEQANNTAKKNHDHPIVSPTQGYGAGAGTDIGGLSHAAGGPIKKTGPAMVNEAGQEVAYNPKTGTYRLLGKGPAITQLRAGEHVINAKDTHKLLHGGLGAGKTLPGYAAGTTNVSPTAGSASVGTRVRGLSLSGTEKSTKKSMTKISRDITGNYSKATKKSGKTVKTFKSTNTRDFKGITSSTNRQTNKLRKNTVSDFDSMQKGGVKQVKQMRHGVNSQMDSLHKGMTSDAKATASDFGDAMSKLGPYAHSAMKSAVNSLNGGISGIDTVLGQFGGNKSVLKPIHYATGSNGPIGSDQLAVLNDSKSGPRQELVGRGNQLLKPVGNDVVAPLRKGDEVFNGDQVEKAKPYLPHFAKGTGASKSKLISLASKNQAHPQAAWDRDFAGNAKGTNGTDLGRGLHKATLDAANSVGPQWYSAGWSVINSLIDGGGTWKHTPGPGWSVSSGFGNRGAVSGGFSSHDGVDFSGAKTVYAMYPGVVTGAGGAPRGWGGGSGIGEYIATRGGGQSLIYQELNGKSNSGATLLVHKGDQVKTGQAIAKLGPSGTHVHVGATKHAMFSIGGSSTAGWEDVTKMKSVKPQSTKDTGLQKLFKQQLGKSAIAWIKKNLQTDDISVGGLSGSVASRARTLAKAIKSAYPAATSAGIAAVLGNWSFESGLNPGAINPGGGASGLGQWLGGRKSNLISYAKKHGGNWKSAATQLAFALNGDGSDSTVLKSVLRGKGSVSSLAAKFSNQWERGGYTSSHVAGAQKIKAALGKGFANGGQTPANEPFLVGEKGPEIMQFDKASHVTSNADSKKMLRSTKSSKPDVKVNLNVKIMGNADGKAIGKMKSAVKDVMVNLFTNELGNAFE